MNIYKSMYRIVFTLTVVPFLMFSLLVIHLYSGRLEKVITDSLRVVADAQVAEMTNFCEQQKDYLALIGNMDMSRAAMRGELDRDFCQYLDNMLYSQVQATDYINTLTIIGGDYRVAACSQEHGEFADEGLERIIEEIGEEDFCISDVLSDGRGNKTLVAIARIEDNEELAGYTLMEISMDFYTGIRERAELWSESTFYLLDGRQQIISAGTPKEGRENFVTSDEDRRDYYRSYSQIDFKKNPRGSFRYRLGGKNYITYYSDIAYTNWRMMLSANMDQYQNQRTAFVLLAVFVILLFAVLSVWFGRFASGRIIQPVRLISGTLQAIQKRQDYSLRVEVRHRDELGSLSEEINGLLSFIETENLYKAQQQRLLQEKAEQDALTKVLNKESISQYLLEAMGRCRADRGRMALLFADVDNFKAFNSQYGHSVGDQVLLFLTSLLGEKTGGQVGRVGGDEFLVVVEAPESVCELDLCLEQLEEAAERRFVVRGSGTRLPVTCSIGAVRVDFAQPASRNLTPEQLIDMADAAMYHSKNNGKRGHVIVEV